MSRRTLWSRRRLIGQQPVHAKLAYSLGESLEIDGFYDIAVDAESVCVGDVSVLL